MQRMAFGCFQESLIEMYEKPQTTSLSHYLRTGQKQNGFRPDSYADHDLCDLCGGTVYNLDIKGIRNERNSRYQTLFQNYELAKEAGKTHKMWQTVGGSRIRPSHLKSNNQKVSIDDNFIVGGEELFLPNDPTASLNETANCRCSVKYIREANETYVISGEERTDYLGSSHVHRQNPLDIFLAKNHGYSVISVRMTSLGDNISAGKIPLSKIKIPKNGGNGIIVEIRGFGSKYDKVHKYTLNRAAAEIRYFAIHPSRAGVIMTQGITFAPIDVIVSGHTYFPTYNIE